MKWDGNVLLEENRCNYIPSVFTRKEWWSVGPPQHTSEVAHCIDPAWVLITDLLTLFAHLRVSAWLMDVKSTF